MTIVNTMATFDGFGLRERDLARSLDQIAQLIAIGAAARAREMLAEATAAIVELPRTRAGQELRARLEVERARLGWSAVGLDPDYALPAALERAHAARRDLGALPPADVRADVAALIAAIACDLGDGTSLERARVAVVETATALRAEGATHAAACLLDDEAAIELRMGHARRVSVLLDRAMELVEGGTHLADVHHLMGRLPLHGPVAGGTKGDVLAAAFEHCTTAEDIYATFERRRSLARVVETQARLRALQGREAEADELFRRALAIADDIQDVIGLARITAGLAELYTRRGASSEAVAMLSTSIELNRMKGSPMGVAFDERLLLELEHAALDSTVADLRHVRARLVDAVAATARV